MSGHAADDDAAGSSSSSCRRAGLLTDDDAAAAATACHSNIENTMEHIDSGDTTTTSLTLPISVLVSNEESGRLASLLSSSDEEQEQQEQQEQQVQRPDEQRLSSNRVGKNPRTPWTPWSHFSLTPVVPMCSVNARVACSRLGEYWSSPDELSPRDMRHTPTDHYDVFLSHSWAAGRFEKLLALCLIFNGRAAFLTGALCGPAVALVQRFCFEKPLLAGTYQQEFEGITYSLPMGCLSQLCGLFTTLTVLLFWQEIGGRFLPGKRIFFDRLCIDQCDPVIKRRGIQSLAAFLKHTDSLVILWSKQYLSRLWCVLELATWVHLNKPSAQVFSLASAKTVMVFLLPMSSCELLRTVLLANCTKFEMSTTLATYVIPMLPMCIVSAPVIAYLRRCMRERMEMDLDLLYFDCEAAECSDKKDREQILATIDTWFTSGPGCSTSGLSAPRTRGALKPRAAFNRMVRTSVRAQFHAMVGREWQLPYQWAAFAGLPWWWIAWDYWASLAQMPVMFQFRIVILAFTAGFMLTPMLLLLVMRLARTIAYSKGNILIDCARKLSVILVVCTIELASNMIILESARFESIVPYLVAVIVIFVLALHAFAPRRPERRPRSGHERRDYDLKKEGQP